MTFEATALIVTWIAIALLGLAMAGLLRQVHFLMAQQRGNALPIGPVVGSAAPQLDGFAGSSTGPSVLLFVSTNCEVCEDLVPEFSGLAASQRPALAFVLLFAGKSNGYAPDGRVTVLTHQARAFDAFRIPVTPFGVAIASDGVVIDGRPIGSSEMLSEFVTTARGRLAR